MCFGFPLEKLVNAPGDVAQTVTEAVARTPEVAVKVVKGVIDGLEKGAEKVEEAFDED